MTRLGELEKGPANTRPTRTLPHVELLRLLLQDDGDKQLARKGEYLANS